MPQFGAFVVPYLKVLSGAGHYVFLPVLTTTQRNALTASAGYLIYNSTTGQVEEYTGSAWRSVGQGVLSTHEALATGVHGVGAGDLVGTTLTQTLSAKTLTSPTINGTIATTGLTMPAFAAGGNIDLGANILTGTNGSFAIGDTSHYALTIHARKLTGMTVVEINSAAYLGTLNTDDDYVFFKARDTGVGLVEVAALVGAADPEFRIGNGGNALRGSYGGKLGFFATAPQAKPTGVAITAAGIHAALVTLGLIAA